MFFCGGGSGGSGMNFYGFEVLPNDILIKRSWLGSGRISCIVKFCSGLMVFWAVLGAKSFCRLDVWSDLGLSLELGKSRAGHSLVVILASWKNQRMHHFLIYGRRRHGFELAPKY